ncbi:cupin domain-containing protein [Paenibacillus gansuensis]|uniref:Cupin domain-containing protein n=1 Tax=Paenibacillus gansuensis TaxID=306542 RepID=A0ABW5PLP3_9BACL
MHNNFPWIDAAEGIRRRTFPPGAGLMSMLIELKAGSAGPEHAHPHEQLTFVVSGSVALTVAGKTYTLSALEQLYVPGGQPHCVEALEDSLLLEAFTPIREDLLVVPREEGHA